MISVIVLTHNESCNIDRCLESVSWSADVLVVDSGSTDGTCELAEARGARLLSRPFDNFANQRNFALEHGALKNRWVLHLDADEVVSPELKAEMLQIASDDNGLPGYRVPSRLMLMGQWLKRSGMYPAYQVRFGSRDGLRFQMIGHGQRELLRPDQLGTLKADLLHYNFSHGISQWMTKHARYARDEAAMALQSRGLYRWRDLLRVSDPVERRRVLKGLSHSLPLRPLVRFVYVYFFRRGILDGRAGLRYAMLLAVYQWMIDINMVEMRLHEERALNP